MRWGRARGNAAAKEYPADSSKVVGNVDNGVPNFTFSGTCSLWHAFFFSPLDDDICDRILKYQVRVQAVLTLQRLQSPEDPEDDVFCIYIFHMVSPIVRQAVITSLGRKYRTIPYILGRLWDVDERVRRHTYIQMSSYPVKQYKVSQRLTFLEQGLNDHSDKVQRVVKNVLIPQWFESYQKNYVAFVKALKIDAEEKEMERFAKTAKLALERSLREYLKTFTAICWHALLEFLQHTELDELDAYMVDLTAFCNYIKTFADTPTLCNYIRQLAYNPSMTTDKLQKMYFQSMMQVLLEIVASYDLGDEVGRENLKKVLAEMLACGDLGEGNVKTIMAIFEWLVGDVEERFRFCVDLCNGILEPSWADVSNTSRPLVDEYLEKNSDKSLQMKISSLRLNTMDLKEQEMEKVNKKDYGGARRASDELTAPMTTLHRLAGIGSGEAALQMCYEIALRPTSTSIWRKWGLVIDEISMVDGDYFEEIEAVARYIRKNDTLFGGNQLILKSFLPKPGPGTIG
ncbi:hypothetical protein pipiens_008788 [Culex pipiens pipiens]|uniref:ATP-dependent DNA helicase n=1 Tax=Culex pipiens pipiens TaxID=38569 RepID=A0ABD1DH90_CULPP